MVFDWGCCAVLRREEEEEGSKVVAANDTFINDGEEVDDRNAIQVQV